MIKDSENIVPTGTYALPLYYDVDYGVKVGFTVGGDIFISMKRSESKTDIQLYFNALSLPDGVTLAASSAASVCYGIISGINKEATMSIDMSNYVQSLLYANVRCDITITYV